MMNFIEIDNLSISYCFKVDNIVSRLINNHTFDQRFEKKI